MNCTAIISQDGEWWIGWVTELPGINAQERTRGKLLETLTELLQEEIESNRRASRKYALTLSEEVAISISD